jgi:transposase
MTVANHLTLNELWRRAKKAKDPIEKDRFLAVYHAKRGLTAKEIARIIPNTPRWVQQTVRRYNLEGPEALKDKRHHKKSFRSLPSRKSTRLAKRLSERLRL